MGMSGGGQSTTQTTVSQPWANAVPTLERAMGGLNDLYDSGSLMPEAFGSSLAPESAATIAGRHGVINQATAGNPVTAPTMAAYGDMVGGNAYDRLGQVEQSALRSALPAAASYHANSGMLNSSVAQEHLAETAARAVAPIHYNAHNQSEGRRLQAMGMAPQMANLSYMDSHMLSQAGAQADARAQAELSDQRSTYYEQEEQDYNELVRLANMAMGFGGMGGTSTATGTQQNQVGPLGMMGALSQLGSLGLMGYSVLSDRRAKENIVPVGSTSVEVPIYTYNYKGDDKMQVGVMSDEVPQSMVSKHPSGLDMVNYGGLL